MKSCGIADETINSQFIILQELIKTATGFGNSTPPEAEIIIRVQINENSIIVEVNNLINETSFNRLEKLDKIIQFFRGYQDPSEAYMIKKREASFDPSLGDGGGLDLFRIAYEGNAILDFFINEDNVLSISSVRKLDKNSCNV